MKISLPIIILLSIVTLSCKRINETRNQAFEYYSNQEYENALELFWKLKEEFNRSHETHKESTYMIGLIEFEKGNFDKAENKFIEVLEPENRLIQILGDLNNIFYAEPSIVHK